MIYDRKTALISNEKIYDSRTMQFLYNTTLGGMCIAFLRLPIFSKVYGIFQRTKRSKRKVAELIKNYDIDMQNFEYEYDSFNNFIIRKLKNCYFEKEDKVLISPSDGCLLVKTIDGGAIYSIKGRNYTLKDFLKDKELADKYEGGTCLIFRLRVYDYHRFYFIDDGRLKSSKRIRGFLDSVNTNVTGKFTLSSNYREVSILQTVNFDDIVFAEVGAMLVGAVRQTNSSMSFKRGEEKGYFEFGGSTIVLLLKKGIVEIDEDILKMSVRGIEVKVKVGERIGKKLD